MTFRASPLKHLLQEAHPCTAQRGASCPHISSAFQGTRAERAGDHLVTSGTSSSPPAPGGEGNVLTQSCGAVVTQPTHPQPELPRHTEALQSYSPPSYTSRIASHGEIPFTPESCSKGKEPRHFCLYRLGEIFKHRFTLNVHALT